MPLKASSIENDSATKKTEAVRSNSEAAPPEFICDCEESMRTACKGLPYYKECEGKGYCVLHYPDKDKSVDFNVALLRKRESNDFDFRGVWFPSQADFSEFTFTSDAMFTSAVFAGDAYFVSAVFCASADFALAVFKTTAYFNGATFSAADFSSAIFNSADFTSTLFGAYAYFISATFEGDADFTSAIFSAETSFRSTTFKAVLLFVNSTYKDGAVAYFPAARFSDAVRFQNCKFEAPSPFKLDGAIFEKPERIMFHTVALLSRWFINVDPRKMNFTDVSWGKFNKGAINEAIRVLGEREVVSSPHRLLAIAYRQLSMNAEDNNRYGEAANLRHAAMLTHSLEIRKILCRPLRKGLPLAARIWMKGREVWQAIDPLHSLYGLASGYGEKAGRAAMVLIMIWLCFSGVYWLGDVTWQQKADTSSAAAHALQAPLALSCGGALVYSGQVITLQKPEPQPANIQGKVVIMLEAVIGPLQAALLALAVRRKFMR